MLEIKDLAVQYGNQAPTIEHFNLSMKKGEIISVVGESGSGKTTVERRMAESSFHAYQNASPGCREYHEQLSISAVRRYASACGNRNGNDF